MGFRQVLRTLAPPRAWGNDFSEVGVRQLGRCLHLGVVKPFYFFILVDWFFSYGICAQPPVPEPPPPLPRPELETLWLREEMPLFPGCDPSLLYAEGKACADSLLLDYIYGNLGFTRPTAKDRARLAVVSFTVERDGRMADVRLVRDPGGGRGERALAVFCRMQEAIRWRPAHSNGEVVAVRFNMPIKFPNP